MGYDLRLLPRPDRTLPSSEDVLAYLRSRAGWTCFESGARFSEDESGASFLCKVRCEDAEYEPEERLMIEMSGTASPIVGLALQGEVIALAQRFDLRVDDPQMGGIGVGEATDPNFLGGWHGYNDFATKVAHGMLGQPLPPHVKAEKLEAAYRWNKGRAALERGDAVFVPKVTFAAGSDGVAETFVAWVGGEGMLPVVDSILTPLRRVPWSAVEEALSSAERRAVPAPHYEVSGALSEALDRAIESAEETLERPALVSVEDLRSTEQLAPYIAADREAAARAFQARIDASFAEREGRMEDALRLRREAAEAAPRDGDIQVEYAYLAHQLGRQRLAFDAASAARDRVSGNDNLRLIVALNGQAIGELETALGASNAVDEDGPAYRTAKQIRAVILLDMARHEEAIDLIEEILREQPDPMMQNVKAYALAALHRDEEARAEYAAALEALDASLAEAPGIGDVVSRRAYSLAGLGRAAEALEAANEALPLVSNPFLTQQTIGRAQLALGNVEAAIEALTLARSMREQAPLASFHLAQAHLAAGNRREAAIAARDAALFPLYQRMMEEDARLAELLAEAPPEEEAAPAEGDESATE